MYIIGYIRYKLKNIKDYKEFKRTGYEQINITKQYEKYLSCHDINDITVELYNGIINIFNELARYEFWSSQERHEIWTFLFHTVSLKLGDKEIKKVDYYNNLVEVIKILEKYME
jgi:hypothetical protein